MEALVQLGFCYANGRGVLKSLEEAAAWYRIAASAGHPVGEACYGIALRDGLGVSKDPEAGLRWIRSSAEKGNRLGQLALAESYRNGNGLPRDCAKAKELAMSAAI